MLPPSQNPNRNIYIGVAVAVLVIVLVWAYAANAQGVAVEPVDVVSTPWWGTIARDLLPLAATALFTVGTALGGFAINWLAVKTGLDRTAIDSLAGPILDTALKNGIKLAVDSLGIDLDSDAPLPPHAEENVIATATGYARRMVPDKIKALKNDKELPNLAKARIGTVLAEMRAVRRARRQDREHMASPNR